MKVCQWTASKTNCKWWHVVGQQCIEKGRYARPYFYCKVEEAYAVYLTYINDQTICWIWTIRRRRLIRGRWTRWEMFLWFTCFLFIKQRRPIWCTSRYIPISASKIKMRWGKPWLTVMYQSYNTKLLTLLVVHVQPIKNALTRLGWGNRWLTCNISFIQHSNTH